MVRTKPMKTLNLSPDEPEREREDVVRRFIRQLQEHINLFRIDDDGGLRFTAAVLAQKRGCRR